MSARASDISSRSVGFVAIGRNEGERLRRCLLSIPRSTGRTVYVDSGSVDGSIELARRLGAEVVELDASVPFTAARARNAGIAQLLEAPRGDAARSVARDDASNSHPFGCSTPSGVPQRLAVVRSGSRRLAAAPAGDPVEFVLVLDGDCELVPGFVEAALRVMIEETRTAVVCGRRRERHREFSIYNALCDMEWNTPVGDAEACGGDALVRVAAFREVGGYEGSIIAGEEPELCLRLRRHGFGVRRIDCDMTLHDAAMTRFSEWWRRAVRAGHAYAELYALHRHWGREVRSMVFYAFVVPVIAVAAAPATSGLSLALFAAHALLYLRVARHRRRAGDRRRDAALYALFCVIAKFAHLAGALRYAMNRLFRRRAAIIEYKQPKPA